MDLTMNVWTVVLGLLGLAIPAMVAHSKLYQRVSLIEQKVSSIDPLVKDLQEIKTAVARIETALAFIRGEHSEKR